MFQLLHRHSCYLCVKGDSSQVQSRVSNRGGNSEDALSGPEAELGGSMNKGGAPSLCWLSEVLADIDRLSSPRSSKHRGEQSPSEPPHRPASSTF